MAENMLIVMMTSFNFILMILLLVITLRENIRRKQLLSEDRESFYSTLTSLSEKLKGIEAKPIRPVNPEPPREKVAVEDGGRNQVKVAIQKLKLGRDPESVGKELGLSRSEMGILMASAKRAVES
jgi:hypothetical protein